jgi:hypothetical protein
MLGLRIDELIFTSCKKKSRGANDTKDFFAENGGKIPFAKI